MSEILDTVQVGDTTYQVNLGRVAFKPDQGAVHYQKSGRSGPNCDNCVELGLTDGKGNKLTLGGVPVASIRDSKDSGGPELVYPRRAIGTFVAAVAAGEIRAPW